MTPQVLGGILTCAMLVAATAWYLPLIVRRRVQPAPATWIIGTLAMNLAMVSYHAIPGRTVLENITLYAAALQITVILAVLMVVLWRSGALRVAFDGFQKFCLGVMVASLCYWATHRDQPGVTFWTTQVLLVVAYTATIARAIQRKTAFDSIGNWACICAASLAGSIPAIVAWSPYGLGNSVRAVVSSAITVIILIAYDRRNGGARWKDEVTTLRGFYRVRT